MGTIPIGRHTSEDNETDVDANEISLANVNVPTRSHFNAEIHVEADEVSLAYVCLGSCDRVLDRPFVCNYPTCTNYQQPLVAFPPIFVCRLCSSVSRIGPRECCSVLMCAYIVGDDDKRRSVLNASQLPAEVAATRCGPIIEPVSNTRTLIIKPGRGTVWEGRHVLFDNVQFANRDCFKVSANHIIAKKNQEIMLSFSFRCSWTRSPEDYCPNCIVQWYVGMKAPFPSLEEHAQNNRPFGENQFCINLVRVFGSGLTGEVSSFGFRAPSFPGIYYITSTFSLDYNFIPVKFQNSPFNAIAVVQVENVEKWTRDNHEFLPLEIRRSIQAFFLLGAACKRQHHATLNPLDCPCRIGGLHNPFLSMIFSFLGPYGE